ncbi:glutaminase [Conyzicola lurida]|uniref:Glutaminase n=1 Tax=Conyzicola lurida TaxID=1172621 RepID=A0A841AK62_9MICO|nr:glutaminase A [Conyzicola lurida]MBB5842101.1 glutaminase [Conyzicola lurida]
MTPAEDALARYDLAALDRRLRGTDGGEVDDSIPELAKADPSLFGVATVTSEGDIHSAGDSRVPFSLQSAVKPFVYALALMDRGDDVLEAVGTEPTGQAFDAIVFESETGRPPNAMVNAGALLTASLVNGSTADERFDRILSGLSQIAGRDLAVDADVAGSERLLGDRNRALGYLMRSAGTLHVEVDDAISVYARACSVLVDTEVLAMMGATLAFGGRNPATGVQALSRELVTETLSVMATCGMYDGSGRWLRRVGLPAKSGVSGGMVAAAPGRLGMGVYSPPLNEEGNSVRGVLASEQLSDELGLHVFG